MLARRFAAAVGLIAALVASQLPEYTQQYRQRLGGAVDELKAIVAEFDAESSRQSLTRDQGIARLRANSDRLAQDRGADLETIVAREQRLEQQQADFAGAGPVSQYLVLLDGFDFRLASRAYADFEPALPVTAAGLIAAAAGLLLGWGGTHGLARALQRRRARRTAMQPRPEAAGSAI